MNTNERIINGIATVIEGLSLIKSELEKTIPDENADVKVVENTVETVEKTVSEEKDTPVNAISDSAYTKEQLNEMKYNELKKLGASLGISCKGTRNEITARILEMSATEPIEEEETELPEEASESVTEEVEETAEADDEEVDYLALANEVSKEMSIAEIKEALEEVGVKPPKKKSEVIMALADAFAQGLIELETEDEADEEEKEPAEIDEEETEDTSEEETEEDEDSDEDSEEDEDDSFELTEDSYFEDFDPDEINVPANLSKKRAKAIKSMMSDLVEKIEEEEITEDDMINFCEDFCSEEELEALGDDYSLEDIIALFCETKKRLIDDDGVSHEGSDPYEINEENFCCGHILKYEKKSKKFICENCGTEYEAE